MIDYDYWWHNLALFASEFDAFHYPFKKEYGEASLYFKKKAEKWLQGKTLELGCGTGWLREKWGIQDYHGIDQGRFAQPFQYAQREKAKKNGVTLGLNISHTTSWFIEPFDTVICYESFNAFPFEAVRVVKSPLLRSGGTFIIIDGSAWWPKELQFEPDTFQVEFRESIPNEYFDYDLIASLTLGTIEQLEKLNVSRQEILELAKHYIQPAILEELNHMQPIEAIRKKLPGLRIDQPDPQYEIVILRKISLS